MANLSWDDLQFFLAVVREGQLSRAARHLGTSHVTVSRRIDRLEQALNTRLFERNPRGYEPTPAGQRLIEAAERMEEAAGLIPLEQSAAPGQARPLRLAMPEGFGSLFSTHLLPAFIARFPLISLELITMPQVLSLSRREADISITLDPVTSGPYRSERLVDYTLHLYATQAHLRSLPPIAGPEDLRQLRFIGYIEEMIFAPGLDYLGEIHPAIRASVKSSSIFNQLAAVRNGLGIGVLPWYVAAKYPELQIVLPDRVRLTRTYWLTCHRDLRMMQWVRAVIGFLSASLAERGHELSRPPDHAGPG
ncbi:MULTISPECIES: LysR family transcriptional regulator [Paracoccus]|jgi:DNA-binding transcriptional LysR family regulator|uniref:Transcriptional regulator, LysR family n=1 Tax=Paracoccus denitrificans (strain Pd 1222) TaxID=318586 RepID=A1B2S1_PARDP|nr:MULTISPECIES: LysR family transcriptional regulator [Paracoccus]ABL69815.1 transcriptional regulator, LysR family [Paracoccus denitrificans PD1222]MBB4629422.1 DNA-binding transcriptional LysR family regulator [Paracoccus denitrificans]MCU7430913.1 LysR family transcriptional regulator [Paracoccus denitrificans]QAR25217.1 LysR family transcriptional regulator [Paracoccus denitrificans]UPV94097.1 LysR family transcriptional regulator [Paracoccus denitrificans]